MGRRAKNKQPPPEPLVHISENVASSVKGKRKADLDDSRRPAKKVKSAVTAGPAQSKGKEKALSKTKAPPKPDGKSKTKTQRRSEEEDVEEEGAGGSGSDGWEDVDDDIDMGAEAQYDIFLHYDHFILLRPYRALFGNSDDEEYEGFEGGLNDLEEDEEYVSHAFSFIPANIFQVMICFKVLLRSLILDQTMRRRSRYPHD
jgi:25S rRNA (cytosine2870-C5)-methyltransferase